jgi:MoxR-like ATPase
MTEATQQPRYEGYEDWNRKKPLYQPPIEGSVPDPDGRIYYPYFPTEELQEAVNLAIALKRPLLLEGEPGCGKTRLAEAIAYEFTQKYLKGEKWWFFKEWNVKSVGRARDGLYTFDAVARLRDAQLVGAGAEQLKVLLEDEQGNQEFAALQARLKDKSKYLDFGALGNALKQTEVERPIVLIDEIDKADSDFPNDLLRELDRLEFTVTETGKTYPEAKEGKGLRPKPIVIITSNRERPLPEPFLRRCLYFKLDFPDPERLEKIIRGRFQKISNDLVERVIEHFFEIRERFKDVPGSKPPSTSEILDFLTVLKDKPVEDAISDLESLAEQPKSHLLGVVLKTAKDQDLYRENFGNG